MCGGFPARDKRVAFARRSCANNRLERTGRSHRALELAADQMIDRIAAAALEEDGDAEERPQQGEFIAAIGPEISELPLEQDDDHDHLDSDDGGSDAREQADREANGGD